MERMIDTHTHLYVDDFSDAEGRGSAAVERAIAAGVDRMVFPNVDLDSVRPMLQLADQFPDNIVVAMGLHPTEIKDSWSDDLAAIMDILNDPLRQYAAVGEVGIDLYWDKTFIDQQMQAFEAQIHAANRLNLPVIIHCRDGLEQVIEVLQSTRPEAGCTFHSFGGSAADVDRIRRVGDFHFGINGIVTFKNSRLCDILPEITLDRMLLETDSPWLAPVPHRGKRNESSYIPLIAERIAQALEVTPDEVARRTTANAITLFPALSRLP